MTYTGTAKGNIIELDRPLPFDEGSQVEVTAVPISRPRKNSPEAWLQLIGTLSQEEAEALEKSVREGSRQIDWELWQKQKA